MLGRRQPSLRGRQPADTLQKYQPRTQQPRYRWVDIRCLLHGFHLGKSADGEICAGFGAHGGEVRGGV